MPIYEFTCRSCGLRFEELVKANGSRPAVSCLECGSAETTRLMSAFAVRSAPAKGGGLASAFAEAPTPGGGGCCGGACGCH